MCSKDAVVQSLYTGRISWADIPSDDDVLELDDWESYNKIYEYAKTSYQRLYNARQRREQMRFTIKKQNNHTRTPYLTLKQNRFEPLRCDSPVSPASPAEVIEAPVKASVIKHSVAETSVAETSVVETSVAETSVVETSVAETSVAELPDMKSVSESAVEIPDMELLMEVPLVEVPIEEPIEELPIVETPKKIIHIKKMSAYEKKCKEKEKHNSKKIHVAPLPPRKKRFSLHNFFINLLIISFLISMIMSGILVFM